MQNKVKNLVIFYNPACLEHNISGHAESPERVTRAMEMLDTAGAWSVADLQEHPPAPESAIGSVHDRTYRHKVKELCRQGINRIGNSTPVCRKSYHAALVSAGGALAATGAVMSGRYRRALAMIRPPGHHAKKDLAMGFCIFNNAALAATHARSQYGLDRILVIDWDAHHGNGVEHIFYKDPGVLYFSVHRDYAYPVTGWAEKVGEGPGKGYNINVPLPLKSGDADYREVWNRILVPVAAAFKPQLVVVCAGFDAHTGDPLGGMNVTDNGFSWLFREVAGISEKYCGGKIVATLEGGYKPGILGRNLVELVNVWSGRKKGEEIIKGRPAQKTLQVVDNVIRAHSAYWGCWNTR